VNSLPLKFGVLQDDKFLIKRSGVTWLCEDGHVCRPNEVIAYCHIGLEPAAGGRAGANPFEGERELQVAFAPRFGGRVHQAVGTSPGGHLSTFGVQPWNAEAVLGSLEVDETISGEAAESGGAVRLLLLAGRRMSALADGETGLLAGWHSRSRAWWFDQPSEAAAPIDPALPFPTLLSMGICDSAGPVRGERGSFTEMFEAAPFPAQIVFVSDQPVTPCAPVLLEQFLRTPAEFQAIAADLRRALTEGSRVPSSEDWFFAAALLTALEHSPIRDSYPLLSPTGLRRAAGPTAILLSLSAEYSTILRHRQLGYSLHVMRHFQTSAGPTIRAWLDTAFTPVKRSVADIKRDYIRLFETVSAATGARFLVINRMSSSGLEDITSYAAFDAPMAETLESIAAKERNLMLSELAEAHDVSVIDVDGLAAELGGAVHLPDGMHQSGVMQGFIRAEIFSCLEMGAG
jgi:hypothetical protein